MTAAHPSIAYFSMEIGLHAEMPTYCGGLGILAGDSLRSAANLGLPMVGVSLLYRHGYFRQKLNPDGFQTEEPVNWQPEEYMELIPQSCQIPLSGRTVHLRAWRFVTRGPSGHEIPILFLDTDNPENAPEDRSLTHQLYAGDSRHRLRQEAVLGLGGYAILQQLGYADQVKTFHMNEGHAAFLTLALKEDLEKRHPQETDCLNEVRSRCVFTTHTPIPAGHDSFAFCEVEQELDGAHLAQLKRLEIGGDDVNMTWLAAHCSRFINGVAKEHQRVTEEIFQKAPNETLRKRAITGITNGIDPNFWACEPMRQLFARYAPEWSLDPSQLRHCEFIPQNEMREAHLQAKADLFRHIKNQYPDAPQLDSNQFTLGFARRATPYKRADLLLTDPTKINEIAERHGGLQILYGGKAHPHDEGGKQLIRSILAKAKDLDPAKVRLCYLDNYDIQLGRLLTAGVDLWLNTPKRPLEASGTSGMKAALNGVPSLSIRDGWWCEGHVEGVTGWSIADDDISDPNDEVTAEAIHKVAASLYEKLSNIVALYHDRTDTEDPFARVMIQTIALNGSHFTTERMMQQYARLAYRQG